RASAGTSKTVRPGVDGCPVNMPWVTCHEYSAGNYPTGILSTAEVALFAPGVYYLGGPDGLTLKSNSLVRPTDPGGQACSLVVLTNCHTLTPTGGNYAAGDVSMGTVFYLKAGATVNIGSNSGATVATPFRPYTI